MIPPKFDYVAPTSLQEAVALLSSHPDDAKVPFDFGFAIKALVAIARGEGVDDAQTEALSEREAEILRLLAQGLTNKDIAQTLILSVRTVEAHLRNIFAKLGVRSRTEAALWAVKHGYGPQE